MQRRPLVKKYRACLSGGSAAREWQQVSSRLPAPAIFPARPIRDDDPAVREQDRDESRNPALRPGEG
jgi:hypothetical protein